MKDDNTIGVDLAKNVICACVVSSTQKVLISKKFTRFKFKEFLANKKPSLVAFEACATAHYWVKSHKFSEKPCINDINCFIFRHPKNGA